MASANVKRKARSIRGQERERNQEQRNFRLRLTAGIAIVVAIIAFVFLFDRKRFGMPHQVMLNATAYVQGFFQRAGNGVVSIYDRYLHLIGLQEEYQALWVELEKSRAAEHQYREAVATNARLRRLLAFKENIGAPSVSAQVIGKDPSPWSRTIIVDRGSNDGIKAGMPVVASGGIVGQVFQVAPEHAKVLLAIATGSAIDVMVQRTRTRAILKGNGTSGYYLEYVQKSEDINQGDYLVTAGYGGRFPTGLEVGRVSQVVKKRRGMFLEVTVTPAVDFSKLEALLIIQLDRAFTD